ncbi:MAG: 3-hydroxy-3-methylglutaryl-CoA reductase, partial [Chloroflexota bacterium]|nr:3-hydroxy-3-methylglutaryl-CoA reductase [Chloroflexota bacterium]
MTSRIPGFYTMPLDERRAKIMEAVSFKPDLIPAQELVSLFSKGSLPMDVAAHMIENVIGTYELPLGIGLNFVVNGRDVLVPMVIEEPSVVAGASFMAKLARAGGGFVAETDEPLMIGQLQILQNDDVHRAARKIIEQKSDLITYADSTDSSIKSKGGGARDLEVRIFESSPIGPFLVVHLIYDVRDAMGANAVNTACERLAPRVEAITGGKVHLRILSNLADRRMARAWCTIPLQALAFDNFSGEDVRDGIIAAYAFAAVDPYRAATHN